MSFKLISSYDTRSLSEGCSRFLFDFQEFTGIDSQHLHDMLAGTGVKPLDFIQSIENYYYTLVKLFQPTNNLFCDRMPWNYCCYLYYKNKIKPIVRFSADGYLVRPRDTNDAGYVPEFSQYFKRSRKNARVKNFINEAKIREERKEFQYRLSPRQIIHRFANELLLFISDPKLCNPHASRVSLENNVISFFLSVPDMDGEDLGTYEVSYAPIRPYGNVSAYLTGGDYNTNGYIHPHANESGDICLGNRASAVGTVYTEGSLLFSLSTLCAVLQTYNGGSPYIELDHLINGESLYCHRCDNEMDSDEVYYIDGCDYCSDCVGSCDCCDCTQNVDYLYSVNNSEITLCGPCLNSKADVCRSCDEYWFKEELVERTNEYGKVCLVCPECVDQWDEDHSEKEEGEAPFHG